MDNLSRYGREECDGHMGFISKHTGMEAAARGVGCSNFFFGRLEGGPNSTCAARPRRVHSLLTIIKPAQEGSEYSPVVLNVNLPKQNLLAVDSDTYEHMYRKPFFRRNDWAQWHEWHVCRVLRKIDYFLLHGWQPQALSSLYLQ